MPRRRKILVCLACCLLTLLLEGCISLYTGRATIVDTGGALAGIGQQLPHLRPENLEQPQDETRSKQWHYRIWKRGDRYLVQLPVCYAPARNSVLVHFAGKYTWKKKTLDGQYPSPRYSDAELARYPVELFYAELTEAQYQRLHGPADRRIKISRSEARYLHTPIFSASEIDLADAEPMPDTHGPADKMMRLFRNNRDKLPSRRAWYNYPLMPLSWVAEVADIPLSIAATPIGWLVDAIYEPLNN